MPIYEYYCADCRRRVSVFFRSIRAASDEAHSALCPRCDGGNMMRLMSRVSRLRSEEERLEGLASPELMSGLAQEDPQALTNFMRGMNRELGDPIDDEMNETLARWEAGASLDSTTDDATGGNPGDEAPAG